MPNEELQNLQSEVRELERLFGQLTERVSALEERRVEKEPVPETRVDPMSALGLGQPAEPAAVQPTPPPVIEPPPFLYQLPPSIGRSKDPMPSSSPRPAARDGAEPGRTKIVFTARGPEPPLEREEPSGDAEYRIGGVILPRIGAAVVLVAIGTFVSMAASRGWINEWMQFWLGVLACAGFIGVGLWKRNEKEEFGQLLTGIGSCGLYLVFTAGHVYLHRYGGEVLVGLFLGLSLANLAFSYVASSRSFFAIGLIGGLAAAVMPMRDDNVTLNAVLHFAIVIPSVLIVAKNRWAGSAFRLAIFACVATVPALMHVGDWQIRLAMLYGTALLSSAAYVLTGDWDFDPTAAFAPVVLIAAACVGMFWVQGGREGTAHAAVLGIACLGAGYVIQLLGRDPSRLYLAGAAVAFCVAPWGFEPWQTPALLVAMSIVSAVASLRIAPKAATSLSWVLFLLGIGGYLWALQIETALWGVETAFLAEAIAAAAVGAWAFNRLNRSPEWIAVGACFLALPLYTRLAFVALNLSPAGVGLYASLLLGWMVFSLFVNLMTVKMNWLAPAAASWVTLLLALVYYVPLALWQPLGADKDALLLLGLIATTAVTVFATSRAGRIGTKEEFFLLAAFLILPIASRLAWVSLTPTGMSGYAALALTWIGYSLALSAVSIRTGWTQTVVFSWLVVLMAMGAYVPLTMVSPLQLGADVALILGIFGTVALAVFASRRMDDSKPLEYLVTGAACLVLPMFSRLAFVLLEPTGMNVQGTLLIGWMSYAAMAAILALRMQWGTASLLGGAVTLLAGFMYLQFAAEGPAYGTDVGMVVALLASMALAAFSVGRQESFTLDTGTLITCAGVLILPVYSRLSWLVLSHGGMPAAEALILGWIVFCLAASTMTWVKRWAASTALSWICVVLILCVYVTEAGSGRLSAQPEGWVLLGALVSVLATALSTGSVSEERGLLVGFTVPLCWALFTRLAVVVLTGAEFGMHVNGAVTLAWSVFATALMAAGFGFQLRMLRYWSLGVFASTLAKVMLVDMAGLDAGLRVGVLMVLGLAMLGVGYWYVRNREALGSGR